MGGDEKHLYAKQTALMRIDAHHHFWQYSPGRDTWIDEKMGCLKHDFLPAHLAVELQALDIDGTIAVQSNQSEEENLFQLGLADQHSFIKGIVGWVDLSSPSVDERLAFFSQFAKLKGFRHVLQDEPRRDFMLDSSFQRGIGYLERYNFTFDLLVLPDQLSYARQLAQAFPKQKFVLDHLGKPNIRQGGFASWKESIVPFGNLANVSCKLSGLVTEASWHGWTTEELNVYLSVCQEVFGTSRMMFGSDWPVCLLAASYDQTFAVIDEFFASASAAERDAIFGGNAQRFYNLVE